MAQLENIEAIEKRLGGAADTLRANSIYASNEYFIPVMGLIFLRHAYNRYSLVKEDIDNFQREIGEIRLAQRAQTGGGLTMPVQSGTFKPLPPKEELLALIEEERETDDD